MAVKPTRMTRTTVEILDVLLSGLFAGEDMHGLEVCRQTGLKSGTVYPVLDRLRRAGWVTTWWEDDETWQATSDERWRPRRRYYRLTNEARQPAREAVLAHRPSAPRVDRLSGLGDNPGVIS